MMKTTRTRWIADGLVLGVIGLAVASGGGCVTRKSVRKTIPGLFPPTPREAVLGSFNLYDPDLRCGSVNLLAAAPFGGEPQYVRVYRLLLDDPDPTVRAACAHALGLHGDVADIERLVPRLSDRAALVRWAVAGALQKIHSPSAAKPLMTAMADDADADVRMAAAAALGQYPQRPVFDALVGALEDPHYSVVAAARRSLETLTGYDFGSDGAMWLVWAKQAGNAMFEHQETYTWKPYQRPSGVMQKVKFWKKKPEPALPRVPTGLEDDSS